MEKEDKLKTEKKKSNKKRGNRGGDNSKKVQEELTKAQEQIQEWNDKYLRLMADFENFKRNSIKQRLEITKTATKDLMIPLLGVLDDIERSKKALDESGDVNTSLEGVDLIFKKLRDTLTVQGLKEMDSIGKEFDPDVYDALCKVPAEKKDQKGKVIDQIEKGYYLNDVIIRHAKVVVGE